MDYELHPGYTLSGRRVTWCGADNPHLYISGQSGTGKSFLLKRLVSQAAGQGALVLAFDYTSDFLTYTPPDYLKFQRIDVTSPDFKLNPLVGLPGQNAGIRAQQLLSVLHSVFHMGAKATFSLLNITTDYLAIDGIPTLEGLLAYISELKNPGKGIESAWEPLELLSRLIHCGSQLISLDLEKPGLTVLDFSNICDRNLCKLVIELLLQAVWTAHTLQQPPLVLILDESQQLHWGAGSMSVRILREGRKFGIAGWFSSQWCDNKEAASALGQAAYQIHFRPDSQHIDKLTKSICDSPSNLSQCRTALRNLRRGQFLCQMRNGQVLIVNVNDEVKVG